VVGTRENNERGSKAEVNDGEIYRSLIAGDLSSCRYVISAPSSAIAVCSLLTLSRCIAPVFANEPASNDNLPSGGSTSDGRKIKHDEKNGDPLDRRFGLPWLRNRHKSDSSADNVGPLGLRILHLSAEPLVDLIFVHGLRGGSIKTWRKGDDPALYWPQNWLPADPDFQHANIHSFGYNADFSETKDSILDVYDFGRALLGEMRTSPHMRNRKTVCSLIWRVPGANKSSRILSSLSGTPWEAS
jgi:hypothetical protein